MNGLGKYTALLSGLDWDPRQFPHGTIEQFIDILVDEFNFRQASIRPLLQSNALIQGVHAGEAFRIAVSGAAANEAGNPLNKDCLGIESLADLSSMHEAVGVAADLRTYYLRHFPGRCHRNTGESNFDSFKPRIAYVYIAFFDRAQHPPSGGW